MEQQNRLTIDDGMVYLRLDSGDKILLGTLAEVSNKLNADALKRLLENDSSNATN